MEEPVLEIDDIQGHILPGFASLHNYVVGLEIKEVATFINKIIPIINEISTTSTIKQKRNARKEHFLKFNIRNVDEDILIAHSISGSGFKKLNVNISDFVDSKIREGMYFNSTNLGDKVGSKSDSRNWKFGTPSNPIDYLLIIASDSLNNVKTKKNELLEYLGTSVHIAYNEICTRLPNDIEHFGFKDGISQPAVRGKIDNNTYFSTRNIDTNDLRSKIYAKPGQPLVWPGQFIFGYPTQNLNDSTIPGIKRESLPLWSKNGSFLVLRRLNQDVPLFQKTMENIATDISQRFNVSIPSETLMAKCVGRWKDGTPLTVSPNNPDSEISGDLDRVNNFSFLSLNETFILKDDGIKILPKVEQDLLAKKCPHFAHIRKVNPRNDGTDIGTERTITKLILRRGIPFGAVYTENEPQNVERGLLFMAYQASITEQFEFLQRNWANASNRPQGGGNDFIIGQPNSNNLKQAQYTESSKTIDVETEEEWIFTTGGEYLFTPSISGLMQILNEAKHNNNTTATHNDLT